MGANGIITLCCNLSAGKSVPESRGIDVGRLDIVVSGGWSRQRQTKWHNLGISVYLVIIRLHKRLIERVPFGLVFDSR